MEEVDVSVNGQWLSEIGAQLVSRDMPMLPETEENTVKLAGRDGQLNFGGTYAARVITLGLFVMGDDYDAAMTRMASIFNIRRGTLVLVFSDRPGRRYLAEYRGSISFDSSTGNRIVNIPLKMDDPFPESDERVSETTITTSPGTVTVTSDGAELAKPVIVLTNTGSNTIHGFSFTNEYDL